MRCGVLSEPKRGHGGSGVPSIIAPAECARTSSAPGQDAVFLKLQALLAPLGITRYYTDKAGVYQRHLPSAQHTVGKLTMQKIERKHLTLRARLKRLARKTLCFSRSCRMHDLIIGLYMNQVEFGCTV